MDEPEGTYAPQSPDLSGFQSYEEPNPFTSSYYQPQHHQQHQSRQPPLSSYQQSYIHPAANTDSFNFDHALQQPQAPFDTSGTSTDEHPKLDHFDDDGDFIPRESSAKGNGPGRKLKKPKVEEDVCDTPAPGVLEGIEVKTKFPVARIKRIMQADEDVGKVAQVTPTAVSKALELFMISLVTKAANEARSRSAKKVTAAHLKQAVQSDEQLDFLADIMAKVPDAPGPKKKHDEDESDDVGENRKKKRVGRRKKTKDDDDT